MKVWGVLALAAYVAVIFAANWAVATIGVVEVWPWPVLVAPAAVFFVGAAFPLRDYVQRQLGRRWSVAAIVAGAALSYLVTPHFAVASGVTFLISEAADMAVYTPLRQRFALAVLASGAAALVVDSVVFLWLAFGSEAFLPGQIVGKLYMTLAVVGLIKVWRAVRLPQVAPAPGEA